VVFARLVIEIAVVSPSLVLPIAPPLLVVMVWMAALSFVAFRPVAHAPSTRSKPKPPTGLRTAIVFGALYAVILFAVAVTKKKFGDQALFAVAGLSGLTDMDAITLSTAQMVDGDRLEATTGWRLILVAGLANLVFKGVVVAVLGDAELRLRIAAWFGLAVAGGVVVLWLWPW
jgi:uncharacterized membrane protein (DUF4010 family)